MNKTVKRYLITLVVVLSLTLTSLVFRLMVYPEWNSGVQLRLFIMQTLLVFLVWESNRAVHHFLNKVLPFGANMVLRIVLQIILPSILLILIHLVVIGLVDRWVNPPFTQNRLITSLVYLLDIILTASIQLSYIASHFFKEWKLSLQRAERLEKEKTQVQFDNLKNQINPHFLFNNLTLLDGLIHEDPDMASRFLQHLSKVYRYVLQNKEKELVTLETENQFIHHYVSLLQMRFESALQIHRDFPDESLDRRIVPVTLQIMIENAIKHNRATAEHPLILHIRAEEGWLEVTNNLQRKSLVEHSNGQGLANLKALYHYLSDRPVEIIETPDRFTVRIPLLDQ